MKQLFIFISIIFIAIGNTVFSPAYAESKKNDSNIKYEDNDIMLRIVERTPETISAFYQGREFSQQAIDEILNTCYVTVIVKNKTNSTLWLNLDNWNFSLSANTNIKRIKRDYWKKRWNTINLKPAHRATFGWTLMPDIRDLRAEEGVGGSIVIPLQDKPFTMTANFQTKADKSGPIKTVIMETVKCITNTSTKIKTGKTSEK